MQELKLRSDSDQLSHAYLLVGEEAAQVAREFILSLNCPKRCGHCAPCGKLQRGTHPDVKWVTRIGRRIGIDQIRALQLDAIYPPVESSKKIYVIEGAEDLSLEAANSLLRILEEPPTYLIFLLLVRGLNLLPTILSRCQIIRLIGQSREALAQDLKNRGFSEREIDYIFAVTKGLPHLLARLPEDASSKLLAQKEQLTPSLEKMSDAELVEFFSKADGLLEEREAALEIFKRVSRWTPFEPLKAAEALSELPREKLGYLVQEAIYFYRDLMITLARHHVGTLTRDNIQTCEHAKVVDDFAIFNLDCEEFFQQQSKDFSTPQLMDLIRELELSQWDLRGNANAQLLIEALLFKMAAAREPGA